MAERTDGGIVQTGLSEWVTLLQQRFRNVFGSAMEFDAGSIQQQLVGIFSQALTEEDEVVVAVGEGLSLYSAVGYQLDAVGSWVGNTREAPRATTVTLTLGGRTGTVVAAGRRAQTEGGIIFATDTDVILGADGTITVGATAVEPGAVAIAAGAVNRILDVVSGWETVNNVNPGVTGKDRETDIDYRVRQFDDANRGAVAAIEAIVTAVRQVAGVEKVVGRENPEETTQTINGVDIESGRIYIVAKGGTDQAVAEAIYNNKTAGSITQGAVAVNLTRGTWIVPIHFTRPAERPLTISVGINLLSAFPSDGLNQIRRQLIALVGGLEIGETLHDGDVYAAILNVPGLRISGNVAVAIKESTDLVADITLNQLYTLATADITLTVV